MIRITRKLEFDAGHRIPDHNSLCKNIHGHRYVLEVTVSGELQTEGSAKGMVVDFGFLKRAMNEQVVSDWDHSFLCYEGDSAMRSALSVLEGNAPMKHRTVLLPFIPTVENLAAHAGKLIAEALPAGIGIERVRLYETPNCWADWTGD